MFAKIPDDGKEREQYIANLVARLAAFNITWAGFPAYEHVPHGRVILKDTGALLKKLDPYQHPRTTMAEATSAALAGDGWMDVLGYGTTDANIGGVEHQFFQSPALAADKVPALVAHGTPASRDVQVAPRFQAGQRVRARNINPVGHTRLPRYARGKLGTIEQDHGVFVFPDTDAHFLGEKPQHVYSVRFLARELWGEQAKPKDTVYIAMWDDYLEPE